MLTKTTRAGIQVLLYLSMEPAGEPASPRSMAGALGCSPTYLAKVAGQLVRAGILRAHKGAKGGVTLGRPTAGITLLEIVQALQGPVLADYCPTLKSPGLACRFHQAMFALHQATIETLSKWTLAELADVSDQTPRGASNTMCILHPVLRAVAAPARKRGRGEA
jgi:Rrf2 family protein